ncbi:MAG TPA: transposase domain-containing protein [Clostridia bacterium]|nr:transposase domain-containing protein [Clostridia bacterium]
METAKENGLDPFCYLTYIFKTAPNLDLANYPERISALLPESAPDYCKPAAPPV